jgi:hypothetical protein
MGRGEEGSEGVGRNGSRGTRRPPPDLRCHQGTKSAKAHHASLWTFVLFVFFVRTHLTRDQLNSALRRAHGRAPLHLLICVHLWFFLTYLKMEWRWLMG